MTTNQKMDGAKPMVKKMKVVKNDAIKRARAPNYTFPWRSRRSGVTVTGGLLAEDEEANPNWRDDDEKVVTTTTALAQGVVIEKVSVVSRYGKADELELMLAMML